MSAYRLFPSTSGPASGTSYTGTFISGVMFTVTQGGCWFEGYYWWVSASSQSTSPVKCALWSASGTFGNSLVPGSVVTSGALVAGQWNYIPLTNPVQLSAGYVSGMTNGTVSATGYIAAVGCNGDFPDSSDWWGTNESDGITNGPLYAFGVNGGSYAPPYGMPQGCFSDSGSTDPSVNIPDQASGTDNFWVDVQVSDTGPAGYSGSYRIWPNKVDSNAQTGSDSAVAYNIATEIDISQSVTLDYIHYFVPANSSAAGLATAADVWNISSQASVAHVSSPSWVTESGYSVTLGSTGQWVKTAVPSSPVIPAGNYRVSVYNANGANGSWGAKDATTDYWSSGAGQNGITWGPLTAPNQSDAQLANYYPGTGTGTTGGQPVFAYDGNDDFPGYTTGTNPAQNYWIDLEVTPYTSSYEASGALTLFFPPNYTM